MQNILTIDNALAEQECDTLIIEGVSIPFDNHLNTHLGYESNYFNYPFITPNIAEILNKLNSKIVADYVNLYPELKLTNTRWLMQPYAFKHFPPSYSFSGWHHEHEYKNPYRILCALVYLSNHNCGTEFYNGEVILSKKGRMIIFPTFWTHTHRGQVCPDGKSRFILSVYAELQPE